MHGAVWGVCAVSFRRLVVRGLTNLCSSERCRADATCVVKDGLGRERIVLVVV
jgi:hypothetical protein